MVHELNAIVVAKTEAIRDIGYNWIDARKESSPIIGDNIQKLDVWAGTEENGQMTYAIQFSLRFRTTAQRTTIKTYFTNTIIPNSFAGVVYQHVCGHDEGKGCGEKQFITNWWDASVTAGQKTALKTVYSNLID